MKRRSFLQALGSVSLMTGLGGNWGRLLAAPNTAHKFLLVFLRGGYDAANLLVPVSSSFYYEVRPHIAIGKPDPANQAAALSLDSDWGLHPALRDTLYPLYQKGQAAFIPFAGTDDISRSHFETQDSIELGQPTQGSRDYRSGFLNRLAQQLNAGAAIAFTEQIPIVMQGSAPVPNIRLNTIGKTRFEERQMQIISSMYRGSALAGQVEQGFALRSEVMQDLADEMEAASRNAISSKGFEQEARRIARMMKDKYAIGFVDVGGWDTHVGQGSATGYLANRLEELGRGLNGIAEEMGAQWQNTVVVVISEFGRTFRENGNRGTDHGHGSVYWVLGGGIRGKRIVGRQQKLTAGDLFQNRDYPVLNDYRTVLGGLFKPMYGLNDNQLQKIFPGAQPQELELL